jgi:hypothetical protein
MLEAGVSILYSTKKIKMIAIAWSQSWQYLKWSWSHHDRISENLKWSLIAMIGIAIIKKKKKKKNLSIKKHKNKW